MEISHADWFTKAKPRKMAYRKVIYILIITRNIHK
jgi:hypothetical protein